MRVKDHLTHTRDTRDAPQVSERASPRASQRPTLLELYNRARVLEARASYSIYLPRGGPRVAEDFHARRARRGLHGRHDAGQLLEQARSRGGGKVRDVDRGALEIEAVRITRKEGIGREGDKLKARE